jgi:hypothetical protein
MMETFREFIIGGVLIAPVVYYFLVTLVLIVMLRPVLHRAGFSRYFSSPSIAELSLYVAIFGLVTLCY